MGGWGSAAGALESPRRAAAGGEALFAVHFWYVTPTSLASRLHRDVCKMHAYAQYRYVCGFRSSLSCFGLGAAMLWLWGGSSPEPAAPVWALLVPPRAAAAGLLVLSLLHVLLPRAVGGRTLSAWRWPLGVALRRVAFLRVALSGPARGAVRSAIFCAPKIAHTTANWLGRRP